MQAYRPGHRLPVYAVRWNGLHPRAFLSAGADWRVKLWDSLLPRVSIVGWHAALFGGSMVGEIRRHSTDVPLPSTASCARLPAAPATTEVLPAYPATSCWSLAHPCVRPRLLPLPPLLPAQPVLSFDLGAPVGDVAWAPFSSTVFAAAADNGKVHVFDLSQNHCGAVCVQRVARKARLTRLVFNAHHPILLVGDESGVVHSLKLSPNLRRTFNQGTEGAGLQGWHVIQEGGGGIPCSGTAQAARHAC